MARSTAGEANLIIAAEPIFISFLAVFYLRERLRGAQQAGLLLGFVGLYVIVMRGAVPNFGGAAAANAVMAAALLFECAASIFGKGLANRYPGLFVVAAQFAIGSALTAPLALWEVLSHPPAAVGPAAWFSVAYLSLACSAVGYGVWYWLLPRYNVSAMSGFLFVQPTVGPLLAWLLRGEQMAAPTLVGAVLVLCGVWLVSVAAGREKAAPAD
jgi:O-acetylserine/cysteine efflux transporter